MQEVVKGTKYRSRQPQSRGGCAATAAAAAASAAASNAFELVFAGDGLASVTTIRGVEIVAEVPVGVSWWALLAVVAPVAAVVASSVAEVAVAEAAVELELDTELDVLLGVVEGEAVLSSGGEYGSSGVSTPFVAVRW
jgi:hypothetical protein